ncbi:hypothetical protein GCM10028784_05450 [Myceligenerans cantabricum]
MIEAGLGPGAVARAGTTGRRLPPENGCPRSTGVGSPRRAETGCPCCAGTGCLGRAGTGGPREAGSAVVEVLLAVLLLVPLVYLVVVVGRVQAGTFAAETAAREAVRAVVTAESAGQAAARADTAVRIALRDQGLPDGAGSLDLECDHEVCLTPGGEVGAVVHVAVPLPLVPGAIGSDVPASVRVDAAHVGTVDRYAAVRP